MHHDARFFTRVFVVLLIPVLFAQPAYASKEGGLLLSRVVLDSPGMDESGPVHVEMKRSDSGIETLHVSAFGKTETVPSELLQLIKEKKWLNGIQLSWEKGYREMGGKTVYVALTEGATWGAVVVAVIGFSEDGKFRLLDNLTREQVNAKTAKILE